MSNEFRPSLTIGLLAALGTALCGASWQIATRASVTSSLDPVDLTMLRYLVPGVILAPVLLRHGLWPTKSPKWLAIPVVLGGGIGFGLPAIAGAAFAPVAHMGAFIPASAPIFTTLYAALFLRERPKLGALGGLAMMLIGVGLIAASSWVAGGEKAWIGDLLFILSGALFSAYAVAVRFTGLSVWHATALISTGTAVLFLPIWLWLQQGRIFAAPAADLVLALLMQGVVAGFGAMGFFTLAVRHLGASRTTLTGAIVPIMTAIGGAIVLREFPSWQVNAGIALIIVGVSLAAWRR